MKRRAKPYAALVAALALTAAAVLAAGKPAPEPAAAETRSQTDAGSPPAGREDLPGASGLRVLLDPETGRMRSRPLDPEAADASRAARDRLNTYGADLIQERLPEGGFKVDLRGRFQSSVVATIDPRTLEVTVDCVRAPAGEEATDD